jgi:hypothetical protein
MLTRTQATLFRQLTLGDPTSFDPLLHGQVRGTITSRGAVPSLLRLAALIAMDATTPAYQREVNAAFAAGAEAEDIIGVLGSVTTVVGSALVMAAAPRLAIAMGYDVDEDLEGLSPADR